VHILDPIVASCATPEYSLKDFSGNVATFTADALSSTTDFTASIDWGDSSTSAGVITAGINPGTYIVTGTHTYASTGDKNIIVTVTDIYG